MRGSILLVLALLASAHAGPDPQTLRAVKAAIAKLRSRSPEARAEAARELGRYGTAAKSAVPHLAKALGDDYGDVRHCAWGSLSRIGTVGIPALVKSLKNRDAAVRAGICGVLRWKGMLRGIEPHARKLIVVLRDPEADVRRAGIALFSAMGADGVDALLLALATSQPTAHRAAAEALGGAGSGSVPLLCEALEKQKSPFVRAGICIAFGHMGKKAARAGPVLVRVASRDPKEGVRAEAARAIGRTGASYDAVESLLFLGLAAESSRMREGCIDGLAAYGAAAAPGLVRSLGSRKPVECASAIEALFRMRRPGMSALQDVLRDGTPERRRAAIGLFVRFGAAGAHKEALPGLRECLKHPDVGVRRDAAAALGRLGRSQAVERQPAGPRVTIDVLIAAAVDKDALVRAAALTSLGRLGSRQAREPLAKALTDADARVRMAAHFGRWGVGEDAAAALAGLRAGLKEEAARAAAAEALGRMGLAAEAAVPELADLLKDEQPGTRRAAAQALGAIARPGRSRVRSLRGTWEKDAPPAVRKAIKNGLIWLANNQDADDGFWDCDKHGGGKLFDEGVTGLALWAFLSAGHVDRDNVYAKTVRDGLAYLLRTQQIDGVLGTRATHSFQTLHACAGIALAEAWILTGNPRYKRAIRAAVDYVEAARNPHGAWRYEPRGGKNDTHVTTWMVTVLRLADLGGFAVDPAAYRGAAWWIDKMTGRGLGQIGYNYPGGTSARPEGRQDRFPAEKSQAMTAAGAWCRHLLGGELLADAVHKRSIRLCAELPPKWLSDTGQIDLYYFHFGTLALSQEDGSASRKWNSALRKALLPAQRDDGSWPANGVWGADGGKVYSTALAVLSLLGPYRYPPGFATKAPLPRPQQAAVKALKCALKDDDPGVRAAAEQALGRILPPGW
ncbi:MAG: HEAT repeat domain-containing protein [Planctomycetota bacterium]